MLLSRPPPSWPPRPPPGPLKRLMKRLKSAGPRLAAHVQPSPRPGRSPPAGGRGRRVAAGSLPATEVSHISNSGVSVNARGRRVAAGSLPGARPPPYRSIYLSIYLSIYPYICMYIHIQFQFIYINLSIYLSIHLSIYLSIYLSIDRSIDRSIYPYCLGLVRRPLSVANAAR